MALKSLFLDHVATPAGVMLAVAGADERLCALDWDDHEQRTAKLLRLNYGAVEAGYTLERRALPRSIADQLHRYFSGDLEALEAIPVQTAGTEFQRSVWTALRNIPAGTTRSYAEVAALVARPKAVRAVGLAIGANPISAVVPCHRVIGSDGSLTGYGSGLHRKRWLLTHEGAKMEERAHKANSRLAACESKIRFSPSRCAKPS